MGTFLSTIRQWLTWILEQAVIVIVAVLVLVVLWGVATRFILESPSRWTEEAAKWLLVWVSLLGAAVAFSRQEHLGLDYVVNKLDPKAQLLLAVVGRLIVIGFAASVMIYGGSVLVQETLTLGQLTPALGIKMGYAYTVVPISGAFIVLFCLQQIGELLSGDQPRDADQINPPQTIEAD